MKPNINSIAKELITMVAGHSKKRNPLDTTNRDEWIVTIILSALIDPNHPIGNILGRHVVERWIENSGPIEEWIDRCASARAKYAVASKQSSIQQRIERDEIERQQQQAMDYQIALQRQKSEWQETYLLQSEAIGYTLRYLSDCGVSNKDLAQAFLTDLATIKKLIG